MCDPAGKELCLCFLIEISPDYIASGNYGRFLPLTGAPVA